MKQVNLVASPLRGARAQYSASQRREQTRHEASQPSCPASPNPTSRGTVGQRNGWAEKRNDLRGAHAVILTTEVGLADILNVDNYLNNLDDEKSSSQKPTD